MPFKGKETGPGSHVVSVTAIVNVSPVSFHLEQLLGYLEEDPSAERLAFPSA